MAILYQGWRNSGKNGGIIVLDQQINNRLMACLIDAWRHIHLPSLHCIREIKKNRVFLSEQFVAGDEQHRLSLHGGHPHSPQHHLFLPCLPLLVLRLSPPSHPALCSSGGRGACAATSVPPLPFVGLRRGVLAGRQGHSVY